MKKEKVGTVTEEEKKSILMLHERKIALDELVLSLNNPSMTSEVRNELYEKITGDMGKTKMGLETWWESMKNKYNWKWVEGGSWNIDFQTNEITLVYSPEKAG